MATARITGEITKGVGYRKKQFGVPVEYVFEDGRVAKSVYTADRKKDVVAAMLPGGGIDRQAQAAKYDPKTGMLFFTYVFDMR